MKVSSAYSLMDVLIKTGRRNQIRVCFSSLGHPIIGDKKYLIIRYQCSTYHIYKLRAGTYQVSSDMGVDDLLDEFTGR